MAEAVRVIKHDHADLVRLAVEAVARACAVTRRVQRDLKRVQEVTKSDRSPVTVADFAAQAIVNHQLRMTLGPFDMVGEESAAMLREPAQEAVLQAVVDAIRTEWTDVTAELVLDAIDLGNHDASSESYWTLDPVDGTKGFLRGEQYALALALIEEGEVVLGAMACPNLPLKSDAPLEKPDAHGVIAFARRGHGASIIPADKPFGAAQPIQVGKAGEQIRVCESVESAHTKHDDTKRIVDHLGGAGSPARLDSQAKYTVVARGQADAYLRLPTKPGYVERIWDHAAGMIIATEAGATVTDVFGKPLDFSKGDGLEANRGILCAHPDWHGRILDAISELGITFPNA